MNGLTAGLILDHEFHRQNKWVATICTPKLVDAMIERFRCIIMNNQKEYDRYYKKTDFFISMEPIGPSSPIDYRKRIMGIPTRKPKLSYIMYSDPHREQWREKYFLKNEISFMLAPYYKPTLYHFKKIAPGRIIHFPWAIPDDCITSSSIVHHGVKQIACYGASEGDAYTLRNWCKMFDFVNAKSYSGVENRALSNSEFLKWLAGQDAAIAAGSDDPTYRLTMPKYFEIPATGALLFAQETDDLEMLGFRDMVNCVIFNRGNFEAKARAYLADPQSYLPIREKGRDLIQSRHSLSVRMNMFEQHVRRHIEGQAI